MSVAVIIVSAGRGRRFGGEIPKQYVPIGPACALRRSVEAFLEIGVVSHVLPVIHPKDESLCQEALLELDSARVLPPVHGGDSRAKSVRQGLEHLVERQPDLVLIHDAARPFVAVATINGVIQALETCDGACAALPVVDALWQSEQEMALAPVPRDGLWRAQTPQGFRYGAILEAHRNHDGAGADDVAVAREAGLEVRLVPGTERNFKITTSADLERAELEADVTSRSA